MNHPSISEVSLQGSRQCDDHAEERYTTLHDTGGSITQATLECTRFCTEETSRLRAELGVSVTQEGGNSTEKSEQEVCGQYNGDNHRSGKQEGIESLMESEEDESDIEEDHSDLEEYVFGPGGEEFDTGGPLFDCEGNVVGDDYYIGHHFEIEETPEREDYDDYMGDHYEIEDTGEWESEE
ncbi:FAD dependent oxidoreductase [Penicillium cf. griseofulvum]|uniref:FAD dependent oxidoreductase n=1 Tax=Penicillium cf. griseofulvum TaxID=2972120 RepID=A0A9W9MPR0_9EURO|nr:FAD dependent oxidoreductase [Penicillium cf. griseofulvum]KAJ5441774.1 FAD dependent oxidoreductase [Penicillium cf. griseofulvum]